MEWCRKRALTDTSPYAIYGQEPSVHKPFKLKFNRILAFKDMSPYQEPL